jgi:LmbE family N-acetylglucosaminyl deacetylase
VSDLVVLSPHLDDAALSCGGRIARAVRGGRRVTIATVFTRDEPVEPPSALASNLRRWWRLPPGEVMVRRRAEDVAASGVLGAEAVHLDFAEAPYRIDASGAALYATLPALFGAVDAADEPLVDELAARLADRFTASEIIGPLGVGNHVDHQVVRRALERARPDAAFYEEFPYTEWKFFAVRRALGEPRAWRADVLPLADDEVAARLAAIEAYASQLGTLFRTPGRLRRQLRRSLRRTGGERLWRRLSPAGEPAR